MTSSVEPQSEIKAALGPHWNYYAAKHPIADRMFSTCLTWTEEYLKHPTFCGGSESAYESFCLIVNDLMTHEKTNKYMHEHQILDYTFASNAGPLVLNQFFD